ncbi:hypothetical protein L195_g056622, partial [Trifolium pratense]
MLGVQLKLVGLRLIIGMSGMQSIMPSNDDHDAPLVSTNRWEKPRIGGLKCNVDVAFFVSAGRTATGACFRNNSGEFTAGLTQCHQLTLLTEEGETWTLLQAMNEAKSR